MTACIVGWAHSRFGKLEGEDIESLIVRVAADAIRDAGMAPADIDEIFLGTFNGGFTRQEFPVLARAAARSGAALQARRRGSRMPAPPARPRSIRA